MQTTAAKATAGDSLVGVFRDVDFALDARRLRSGGQVDRVAEETVAGHLLPDDPCHHLATVYADRDLWTNVCSLNIMALVGERMTDL